MGSKKISLLRSTTLFLKQVLQTPITTNNHDSSLKKKKKKKKPTVTFFFFFLKTTDSNFQYIYIYIYKTFNTNVTRKLYKYNL